MKKNILIAAALIVTAVAVFGTRAVKSHFTAVRDGVKEAVRDATPTAYEVKRIEGMIKSLADDLAAFGDRITELEGKAAAQRTEVAALEKSIAADKLDLKTEADLLATDADSYEIHNHRYSHAEVEESVAARMKKIRREEARLAALREVVTRLEADIRDGRARMNDAAGIQADYQARLEMLSAQMANAELAGEINALAEPLREGAISASQSELNESLQAFERRVKAEQRKVAGDAPATASPALIRHRDNPLRPSLLEEVRRVLGESAE